MLHDLSPSSPLDGLLPRYAALREIGHGEYGIVYLTRRADGGFYAVKVVRRPAEGDTRPYERELCGVRAIARLPRIEGLVRIHDVGEAPDGSAFAYAMDLADPELDGPGPEEKGYRPQTLASVVAAEVALPLRQCLDIGIRIASVLAQLQRRHIVHRDIKPGNIVFVRGQAVLADVGLAIDDRDAASIVGTPGYAPPERRGSAAGDVFGLGKTLYRISTGRLPEEEGLPPCVEADIDAPFFWKWMVILSKATARDPSRRYRSAKGLLRELRRLRRLRSRPLRIALWTTAVAATLVILLPALWHMSYMRAWVTQDDWTKTQLRIPFPYSLARPFLVPKNVPEPEYVRAWKAFENQQPDPEPEHPFIQEAVDKSLPDPGREVIEDFDHANKQMKELLEADAEGKVIWDWSSPEADEYLRKRREKEN